MQVGQIEAVLCAPIGSDPPRRRALPAGLARRRAVLRRGPRAPPSCSRGTWRRSPIACWSASTSGSRPDAARFARRSALDGVVGRSEALARAAASSRAGRAARRERAAHRRVRHRQEPDRARHPRQRPARPRSRSSSSTARALPEPLVESELFGALAGRALDRDPQDRRQGRGRREGHALPRRDRRPVAGGAGEAAAAAAVEGSTTRSAARKPVARRRPPRSPRPTSTCKPRSPSAASARTSSIGCRCCRCACRRWRERRDDVAELAAVLLRAGVPSGTASPRPRAFACGALRAAETAEWPGNVRQLAHAIEAAAIRAAGERRDARSSAAHLSRIAARRSTSLGEALTFQEATRRFQARLLRDALEEANWNVAEVARRLDLRALARLQPDQRVRPRASVTLVG